MKQKCPAELNSRVVRISIGDYILLTEVSRRAGVTMAEALHLVIEHQGQQVQVTRVSPVQTRMIDVIMPSQVTARVMMSRVTGNGVAHIRPKIIREVR